MDLFKRFQPLLFALCLFGMVFGTKLWVIEDYGSDMPNWDQWDAEAADLLLPYQKGELRFSDLFKPHNEHRIFFTKITSLLLLEMGGQWDTRAQCVVSALLHGFFAAGIFLLVRSRLDPRWHIPLLAACTILFGLPTSWHNVISGFQSQFYFLLLFSVGCIALILTAREKSCGWWLGLALGVLAIFTMGSGVLAAGVVLAIVLLRLLLRHTTLSSHWLVLTGCGLAIAVGCVSHVTAPWHEGLHARSLGEFFAATAHLLQWPTQGSVWVAFVIHAPWFLLLARILKRHRPDQAVTENLFLALGLWVILQCMATGYARGEGAPLPGSRYCDTLAFGLLINVVILAYLLDQTRERRWPKFGGWALLGVWLCVVVPDHARHLIEVFGQDLPSARRALKNGERNVSLYLTTGEDTHLDAEGRPHPSAATLKERLSHPEIRKILPASLRPAVPLTGRADPENAFVAKRIATLPPSYRTDLERWSSKAEDGASGQGRWQSESFKSSAGYLRIEMSGHPRSAGTSLHVVDAATGHAIAKVEPTRQPDQVWRTAYVAVPDRAIRLVAEDTHATQSLSFSQPVETSTFSFLALRLVKQGWLIFIFSTLGAALLMLVRPAETIWKSQPAAADGGTPPVLTRLRALAANYAPPPKLAGEHAFGLWWLAAGVSLALLKLWLVAGQTVLAVGGAGHDDQLFVDLAEQLRNGHWLGTYSQFTLMKGPMYSIFMALTHWLGVPLFTAQQLLYIAACAVMVRALRPLCPGKTLRFALYAVLLFNPVTYESLVHGRVLRQDILPGLVLLIVAGFVALYSRSRDTLLRLVPWAVLTGVALGMFWLTREEGVWLVPFVLILWTAAAVAIWRDRCADRILRLKTLALPAIIWGAMVFAVASTNLLYYGVFTTCEFKHKDFKDAFGALLRVEPAQWRPYISVSREMRERLYKLSPTFAELQPYLDGSLGEAWARPAEALTRIPPQEREIAVGWFMWALRDAVAEAGHCDSGTEAMNFYRKMASEINSAVYRGKIKGGARRSGFLSPLRREHIAPFFSTLRREIDYFTAFEDMHTTQFHSMGPPDYVQRFRDMTRSRVAPLPEQGPLPQTHNREDQLRLSILEKILRCYQAVLPWLRWLSIAAILATAAIAIRKRRWSYFFCLTIGCVGSTAALVLINTLIEITSFPALNTGYFTGGYGLWLLGLFAAGLSLHEVLKPSAPPQPPASPKEN